MATLTLTGAMDTLAFDAYLVRMLRPQLRRGDVVVLDNLNVHKASQVEFVFGGALGVRNFFFQFGGHAGRWQDLGRGFIIGDLVPAGTAPAAPIERRYTIRPSAGVSYRLPLP